MRNRSIDGGSSFFSFRVVSASLFVASRIGLIAPQFATDAYKATKAAMADLGLAK